MAKKKMIKRKSVSKPRSTRKVARPPLPTGSNIEVIARAVIVHRGRVLLCQSVKHGYLYLPGGHVEFGEAAAAAAAREIEEELGVNLSMGSLAMVSEGVFNAKRRHHEINLVFHVELSNRASPIPQGLLKPKSREKHIAFRWVDLAAAQDLDIRPTAVKAWLAGGMDGEGVEWISEVP
ncbi:MAG: NUDIX domain-containing protein [Phycisphaeraceae bacterium]|nr:NUDIX domain-containing protein [Phycisphaeraceae bacterium]